MIAMQYKIKLPDNYDMNLIRQRVTDNGAKTDGFQDLLFKAYLISEKTNTPDSDNEYSPLYLWKNNEGMNQFIFNGFYDNILRSFGWQKINIGIPLRTELGSNFYDVRFAIELEKEIPITKKMEPMQFSFNFSECSNRVLIYNPDKWKYVEYYFFKTLPEYISSVKVYEVLHLSHSDIN